MNIGPGLATLLAELKARDYAFVTPTPATHARVLARPDRQKARDLADVFGWSLPFAPDLLDADLFASLDAAGLLDGVQGGLVRSLVRVSSLGPDLFAHSAYPTDAPDAVFFGPDSYRFADFIARDVAGLDRPAVRTVVDIGTGSGVGAIVAARQVPTASVIGTDINPHALAFARANAAFADVELRLFETATLAELGGPADLILANPPYIVDVSARAYRDGGGRHGADVSLEMAQDALRHLGDGGTFLLYTGSAIVGGRDALREELEKLAAEHGCTLRYREIDPDVFGEELENPAYADVDRIAVIGAVLSRT